MPPKKTLVLGASSNPSRYSYLAVQKLQEHLHPVIAVGKRESVLSGIPILTEPPEIKELDTVTIYLNPNNQKNYYDYILSLRPRRVIFNPGAENPELENILEKNGIATMEACTLVLLGTGQF